MYILKQKENTNYLSFFSFLLFRAFLATFFLYDGKFYLLTSIVK